MKICENGIYRDMTTEEIAAMQEKAERMTEEMANQIPTAEERLEALESAMLAMLGGGL